MTEPTTPYGFTFRGQPINAGIYGPNYIPELCRVLKTHASRENRNVLEWGSGLTTQVLAEHGACNWRTEHFITIDENAEYQSAIFVDRPRPKFLIAKVLPQIGPGKSQQDPELNYSSYPLIYRCKFDLIFIDGRRRMECAFISAILSHSNTVVIIHDYRRSRYQPVLSLFDVIEDGPQFRVMCPRPAIVEALKPGADCVSAHSTRRSRLSL